MAPINREVILVSGLYGERGAFLPRQPIQWTLTPDSVGHFLDVSDPRACFDQVFRNASLTRSETFIVTKSSQKNEVITRGTVDLADDVTILSGQSWVVLTSPTEGSSHISVLAKDAENWDQRRQIATVYWVDVQWVLPAPSIVPAGSPHTVATAIRRTSGKPQPGWIVRYELVDSNTTSFANGQQAAEVMSDEMGLASVNLAPAARSGQARILVQIIRAARPDDDLPRMIVGQGWTTVTWSAADPQITLSGPQAAGVGSTATYSVQVSNAGDLTAKQVTATATVPANMTFLQSDPPARVIGDRLTWDLGDLAPGAARPISISLRPERNATVRFCVRVQSADQVQGSPLQAEACVETRVFSSSLAIRVSGPEQVEVGQRATFDIEVTNAGHEPLSQVTIRDRLPAGLEHPTERGALIERVLDAPLAPGAGRKISVELIVRAAGRLCHTLEATAEGGHSARATACVVGTEPPPPPAPQPRPSIDLQIEGAEAGRVGDQSVYTIVVTNTGNVPLSRIRLTAVADPSLLNREASAGFDVNAIQRGELLWVLDSLAPSQRIARELKIEFREASPAARLRASVDSAEGVGNGSERRIQVAAVPQPSRPREPAPRIEEPTERKPDRVQGRLEVDIADSRDPIAQGGITTYLVEVVNGQNVADKDVVVTLELPPGMKYEKLSGPVAIRSVSNDGRLVQLEPIRELRAGESIGLRFDARGAAIGKHVVTVRVNSWLSRSPVEAVEDTTVNVSG